MSISSEASYYIRLVEQEEKIEIGIQTAVLKAKKDIHRRGHSGETFWIVITPSLTATFEETLFLADSHFILYMAKGTHGNEITEKNYQIYSNEKSAIEDAKNRWKNFLKS
jgi:hypothetical protein